MTMLKMMIVMMKTMMNKVIIKLMKQMKQYKIQLMNNKLHNNK